jgi:hypothetical protein
VRNDKVTFKVYSNSYKNGNNIFATKAPRHEENMKIGLAGKP